MGISGIEGDAGQRERGGSGSAPVCLSVIPPFVAWRQHLPRCGHERASAASAPLHGWSASTIARIGRLSDAVDDTVARPANTASLSALGLSALGVVFSDIGTSPLYMLKTV